MKKIAAIILAAGESSRLWPFNGQHKSLIKIMGKPLIWYTIEGLKKAGIKNIIIAQGIKKDVQKKLENYDLTVNIEYVVQEQPNGMGDALLQAKSLLIEQFFLVLPERIDCEEIVNKLKEKIESSQDTTILVGTKTETPHLFGILKLDNDKIIDIVEKPKKGDEPSNTKALGIYALQPDFFKIYDRTAKHHYDFEIALSEYMKTHEVRLLSWDKETIALKYPWDLLHIKNYLLNKIKRFISKEAEIAKSAELIGEVYVEDGVLIMENVVIKGPCYVGKNAFIGNNAILRGGIDIGENAVVGANMEIKNSILMQDSTTHSGYIGDSVIGKNCKIAAGFITANVRLDRGSVKATVRGEKIDTGLKMLGVMMGDNSNTGIKVTVVPGVIIGKNVTVGSNTTVMGNVQDDTKYYSKFQEIINKKNG